MDLVEKSFSDREKIGLFKDLGFEDNNKRERLAFAANVEKAMDFGLKKRRESDLAIDFVRFVFVGWGFSMVLWFVSCN